MPVGTVGTIKGVDIGRVAETGAQIVLANTYHLLLRPGDETVAALGDLHEFIGWSGPILTDSGGFQVFSLSERARVTENGVRFRSHIDGSEVEITPERSIAIQENLGSDLVMAFDHVVELPNSPDVVAEATWRSVRWAQRCRRASTRTDQMLLAIVQGGLDPEVAPRVCPRVGGSGLPGVRGGRLERRRIAGRDGSSSGSDRAGTACRTAPLPDGRRPTGGLGRGNRPGHRHVRLRDADA